MNERLTRAEKKAETRERLLRAAVRIAEREGFAALTVNGVAEEAGLTKGAVYSNFDSKEDFLLEVVGRLTPGLQITDDVFEAGDLEGLIERVADALVDMAKTKSRELMFAIEFDVLAMRDATVRAALLRAAAADDRANPVDEWLARHAGDLPLATDQFVEALNAVAWGIVMRRLVYGTDALPDDLVRWILRRFAG